MSSEIDEHEMSSAHLESPNVETATPHRDGRDANGRFGAGNLAHWKHGLRSSRVREGLTAEARQALQEKREEIARDLGGMDAISAAKQILLTRYVELNSIADTLAGDLAVNGPLAAKGSRRAALAAYLLVVDRLVRIGAQLGLDRVQRKVDLAQHLAQLRNAGQRQPVDAHAAAASPGTSSANGRIPGGNQP